MAEITGTVKLTAPISPTDSLDEYSTHSDEYGEGGYRSVADIAARDAIPDLRRKEGMLVKVNSPISYWTLEGGITNGDWVEAELGGGLDPDEDETVNGEWDFVNGLKALGFSIGKNVVLPGFGSYPAAVDYNLTRDGVVALISGGVVADVPAGPVVSTDTMLLNFTAASAPTNFIKGLGVEETATNRRATTTHSIGHNDATDEAAVASGLVASSSAGQAGIEVTSDESTGELHAKVSIEPTADDDISTKKYVDDNSGGGLDPNVEETVNSAWEFADGITSEDVSINRELPPLIGLPPGIKGALIQEKNFFGVDVALGLITAQLGPNAFASTFGAFFNSDGLTPASGTYQITGPLILQGTGTNSASTSVDRFITEDTDTGDIIAIAGLSASDGVTGVASISVTSSTVTGERTADVELDKWVWPLNVTVEDEIGNPKGTEVFYIDPVDGAVISEGDTITPNGPMSPNQRDAVLLANITTPKGYTLDQYAGVIVEAQAYSTPAGGFAGWSVQNVHMNEISPKQATGVGASVFNDGIVTQSAEFAIVGPSARTLSGNNSGLAPVASAHVRVKVIAIGA